MPSWTDRPGGRKPVAVGAVALGLAAILGGRNGWHRGPARRVLDAIE